MSAPYDGDDLDEMEAAIYSGRGVAPAAALRLIARSRRGELAGLQRQAYADSKGWFPALHERGHLAVRLHYAIGLNEEAGEVGGVIKKANLCGGLVDECELHKPGKHSKRALADEMADVFIYLLAFAEHEGIDIVAAVAAKKAELRERWGDPS